METGCHLPSETQHHPRWSPAELIHELQPMNSASHHLTSEVCSDQGLEIFSSSCSAPWFASKERDYVQNFWTGNFRHHQKRSCQSPSALIKASSLISLDLNLLIHLALNSRVSSHQERQKTSHTCSHCTSKETKPCKIVTCAGTATSYNQKETWERSYSGQISMISSAPIMPWLLTRVLLHEDMSLNCIFFHFLQVTITICSDVYNRRWLSSTTVLLHRYVTAKI
jgi:hypothetical protein